MDNRQRRKTSAQARQHAISSAAFYFVIILQFFFILAVLFIMNMRINKITSSVSSPYSKHIETVKRMNLSTDAMAQIYANDGTSICLYVITDPNDGTQYVVCDRGGVCPRPINQ